MFCRLFVLALYLLFSLPLTAAEVSSYVNKDKRPNIVLIVADDLGFADLGSFGAEIETPNLDRIANQGIRFSNFLASPTCSVTRSMMLTGVDSHKAGLGNMHEELAPNQKGQPGYEGYLNNRTVTIASLLRDSGYRTYISGKWHLGLTQQTSAYARGFEQSFTLLQGGASHYSDMKPAYAPSARIKAKYRSNGQLLEKLPHDFRYSSQFYVDQMIRYIGNDIGSQRRPFFAYLAFTAPHWPLQAPAEVINKYRGRYQQGYDELARQRLAKQLKLGLLPKGTSLAPKAPGVKDWRRLTAKEKKVQARAMEIYAAMVDQIDFHSGRLFDYLSEIGEMENTVVIFLSDNGAEGHTLDQTWPMDAFPDIRTTIDSSHDFSFENMGRPNSYTLYGEGWAHAGAPGFRLYKGYPTQGGIRVAAFIYGKGLGKPTVVSELVSVKDLAPTILELASVQHPENGYQGRRVEPMTGRSLLPLINGERIDTQIVANELMGKRFVQQGHWKIVNLRKPYGSGDWQLFNLSDDQSETVDLKKSRPEKFQELFKHWQEYERHNGVILPDWVSGY